MNPFRTKKGLAIGLFLILSLVFVAIFAVSFRRADGAVTCLPIIAVTNYQQFSALLKHVARNLLITQLKANVSREFSLSYKPGNFTGLINGNLSHATDFSPVVSGIVGEGLKSQSLFVNSKMNVANFTTTINKAVLAVLNDALQRYRIDRKNIIPVLNNYQKALNSDSIVGTYSGPVNEYRSMASDLLPVMSNLMTQMTGLSGKIDVASSIGSKQRDVINTTRAALGECITHTRDGLKLLANIAGQAIGDSVNVDFAAANTKYLKESLGKLGSRNGKAVLSNEDVEKVILRVNNAAVQTVPQYITGSANSLINISSGTAAAVGVTMKTKVQSALAVIDVAIMTEKEKEDASKKLYSSIEKDVIVLVGDKRSYETFAREKSPESLIDDSSLKKIMILLAGRESSANLKKLAIKHYITARTSFQFSTSIKTQLNKFDPGVLDNGYEEQAWKDLARFQYYLLVLENQQLKLMAIRAMAQAVDTDDPDVLRYAAISGLPVD